MAEGDILKIVSGHQAFAAGGGEGGEGVTVTDGTTSVAATSIQMPGGTVSDLGSGVAGVGLILRQLGPFTINYNTNAALYTVPGLLIATIPVGTIIIDIWASLITPFVKDPIGECLLGVTLGDRYNVFSSKPDLADEDAVSGSQDPYVDLIESGSMWSVAQNSVADNGQGRYMPAVVLSAGGTPTPAAGGTSLGVRVFTSDPVSQGQFKVYALVASPAS